MNKLRLQIPTELYTERLLIRAPQLGDAMVVYQAICESITELKPWIKSFQNIPTKESIETLIVNYHIHFLQRSALPYFIFSKTTGEFIGLSIFHEIDWEIPKFELGYWVHSRFRKKGYMTEGIKKLIKMAFEELQTNRIEIRCEATNIQSRMIPEKLQFKMEGILENNTFTANKEKLTDVCIYAMIKSHYYSIISN
ncbi:GNAT family N-acetyltransferase [Bacillus cereus]